MSRQKKIMLLGGIHYLLPVIKAAHEQGYYAITADYLPDNVAHKYSDEFVNVSIVDKEAVLAEAQEHQIDGIISFGVDPGVVAAAYVQEKMGLPSMGPYESVVILQNKDLFRAFLQEHGFNCPKSKGYSTIDEALKDTDWLTWPMIVKPTDSAGSKGVTRVDSISEYEAAVKYAFEKSIKGHIIVEQYLEKVGCSSDTDSFLLDGKLRFVSFNAQRFDADAANPYAPSAYTWPSTFPEHEAYLTSELQRLMDLLHMRTSVFNIETRIATDGKPYIMECTPRGGGNRLCEMLRYATGVDMITAQVRAAVGDPVGDIEQKPYNGHWAEVILHAPEAGKFAGIEIAPSLKEKVVECDLWVKDGDRIESFRGANDAIGTLVLRFEDKEEMEYAITHQSEWLEIKEEKVIMKQYQIVIGHLNITEAEKLIRLGENSFNPPLSKLIEIPRMAEKWSKFAKFLNIYNGKEVAATIVFYENYDGQFVYITHFVVLEKYRHNGIGHGVLSSLISEVKSWANSVRLEVRKDNSNAISFYKREGFCLLDVRKESYILEKKTK